MSAWIRVLILVVLVAKEVLVILLVIRDGAVVELSRGVISLKTSLLLKLRAHLSKVPQSLIQSFDQCPLLEELGLNGLLPRLQFDG